MRVYVYVKARDENMCWEFGVYIHNYVDKCGQSNNTSNTLVTTLHGIILMQSRNLVFERTLELSDNFQEMMSTTVKTNTPRIIKIQ